MGRVCEICGRGTTVGNTKKQRGKPKKEGGVGRRTTGVSKRKFKPNIQKVKALVDGAPKRINVCTKCIKEGKVTKYIK